MWSHALITIGIRPTAGRHGAENRRSGNSAYSASILIALLIILLPRNGISSQIDCGEVLALIAYEEAETRDVSIYKQFVDYKNGHNPHPKTIDLSEWCASGCSALENLPIFARYEHKPTEYERAVLGLKQGDKVVFDGKSYTLGKFLGSGNATHIFELADRPDAVIRLPFLSAYNNYRGRREHGHAFTYAKYRMEQFEKSMESGKQTVKIIERDPQHRYVIVSKVHGSENGLSFLKSLSGETVDYLSHNPSLPMIYSWMNGPNGAKVRALISAMEKNRDLMRFDFSDVEMVDVPNFSDSPKASVAHEPSINPYPIQWGGRWSVVRQYVWDVKLEQWIKVDDA